MLLYKHKKIKTTKKDILYSYDIIVGIRKTEYYNLFKYICPTLYISGENGWEADIYLNRGVAIVEAYMPFSTIPHSITNEVLFNFNNKIKKIDNKQANIKTIIKKCYMLFNDFTDFCINYTLNINELKYKTNKMLNNKDNYILDKNVEL